MAMDLFSFINTMFKKDEWEKIPLYERGAHYFMVTRFCSIKYPIQASYFNHIKIHPGHAVTYWQDLLSKLYNKTPHWMYIKTKKAKEAIKSQNVFSDDIIKSYCEKFQMSKKDFEMSIKMVGEDFIMEVKEWEKLTS